MNGNMAQALSDVAYADRTLLELYQRIVERTSSDVGPAFEDAMEDHQRHQASLETACEQVEIPLGGPGDDVVELMEEHVRAVEEARDVQEMLAVLTLAEHVTSVLYAVAEREDLPEELSDLITELHADERLHVSLFAQGARAVSA